ncbi:hypothetical protein U1Q18_003498 [Sarracenia purpurea var. burkii]
MNPGSVTTDSGEDSEQLTSSENQHSSPEEKPKPTDTPPMVTDENFSSDDSAADFVVVDLHRSYAISPTDHSVPEKCSDSVDKEARQTSESQKLLVSPMEAAGVEEEKATDTARMQSTTEENSSAGNGKMTVLKPSPSVTHLDQNFDPIVSPGNSRQNGHQLSLENGSMMDEAWERLNKSYVYFKGMPVGTLAALDPSVEALNYNQVFVRDFFPTGLACLMKSPPEPEIVKNFLLKTLHLQGSEKRIDNFTLGEGVMPASFKVSHDSHLGKDKLFADFGGSAIGRVAPVDSGFWWIILLRSYTKCTRDHTLSELPVVQRGMKLILSLCLSDGFDTFPTLLCADGCSMIDRRMVSLLSYVIDTELD